MKTRVFVVGDEIIFSEHIQLFLKRWGCDVLTTVASGEKALEILEDGCQDSILSENIAGIHI